MEREIDREIDTERSIELEREGERGRKREKWREKDSSSPSLISSPVGPNVCGVSLRATYNLDWLRMSRTYSTLD